MTLYNFSELMSSFLNKNFKLFLVVELPSPVFNVKFAFLRLIIKEKCKFLQKSKNFKHFLL